MIKKPLFTLTALATVIINTSVMAQDEAVEAKKDIGLETIIVTSERINNNLQNTPVAVTAFSEAQIERVGAQGLEDLRAFVPNFTISESGDYGRANPSFNIRGVGAGTSTAGVVTEKPVGLYVDGIYLARAQGSLLSVIDASSIEVLRGPQGTLFGRNTTGGAVSYISKKPTDEFDSSVMLTVGNQGRFDALVNVNAPLTDNVFFRGVVSEGKTDGYINFGEDKLGSREESVYRGQLRIQASNDVTIDLSASHMTFFSNGDPRVISEFELRDNGSGAGPVLDKGHFKAVETLLIAQGESTFVNNDPRLVMENEAPSYCILDDTNPLTFDDVCKHPVDSDMTIISANVDWVINEELSFKSLTGYTEGGQEASTDFPFSGAYRRSFDIGYDSFQQEFQLTYRTDKLDFVSGLIYYTESGDEEELTFSVMQEQFGPGYPYHLTEAEVLAGEQLIRRNETYHNETESYGVYAQGSYEVTDKLKATLGLRYSYDSKEVDMVYIPSEDDPRSDAITGSESWGNLDYRLAASYQHSEDLMFYASVSEAYKAGIANDSSLEARAPFVGFIPEEEALGFEIGMRSEMMDNRLRVNLTAYQTDYTNRQGAVLETITIDGVDQLVFVATNLGDVAYQGFEGEITYAATESLTLTASFGLTDYEQELEPDNALPYVPEESFSIGILHYTELSNNATLSSSLNYGWNGEMWAEVDVRDASLPGQTNIDSYGVLTARLDYMPGHDNWSLGIFVNNLLDERYATSASPQGWHFGTLGATGD